MTNKDKAFHDFIIGYIGLTKYQETLMKEAFDNAWNVSHDQLGSITFNLPYGYDYLDHLLIKDHKTT